MAEAISPGSVADGHAAVIGGSVAGLLAARVLADHYGRVTVLERDALPEEAAPRKGVPQGRHTHAMLSRGAAIVEGLFPGFIDEMVEHGGVQAVFSQDGAFVAQGRPIRQFSSDMRTFAATRPLTEERLRERVRALPNVDIVEDCDALGPIASSDNSRITALRVRHRGDADQEERIEADLVVDASGRGSRSPKWLEELGYAPPAEERLEVDVRYMTRFFKREPRQMNGRLFVVITARPDNPRVGIATSVEGDRWMVTLCGYAGDQAPADEAGYREFAASLAAPDIAQLLEEVEPCSDPIPAGYPANQWRHYEKLKEWPDGYLVFGDAMCSLNPLYGQGMSVSAMEATLLQENLQRNGEPNARQFFRDASKAIEGPWMVATGGDLDLPVLEGRRPPMVRVMNAYFRRVMFTASRDEVVSQRLSDVINLECPPTVLLNPRTVSRVLAGSVRGG